MLNKGFSKAHSWTIIVQIIQNPRTSYLRLCPRKVKMTIFKILNPQLTDDMAYFIWVSLRMIPEGL